MEHDIRDLFKKDDFEKKKLPNSHTKEFIQKLEDTTFIKQKKTIFSMYKIAGIFLLMIVGFTIYFNFLQEDKHLENKSIIVQIKNIEQEYIKNIDKEWQQFIKITNDTFLINKYHKKLKNSASEYKILTLELEENPNNIQILENLIQNLQQRLQLLKDIQEHINELNIKSTTYETIYL